MITEANIDISQFRELMLKGLIDTTFQYAINPSIALNPYNYVLDYFPIDLNAPIFAGTLPINISRCCCDLIEHFIHVKVYHNVYDATLNKLDNILSTNNNIPENDKLWIVKQIVAYRRGEQFKV